MTLTEFLLARITEDEAPARANLAVVSYDGYEDHGGWWDPARVLAECEAKRQLVEALSLEGSEHFAPFEREWEWCPAARASPLGDLPGGPGAECTCPASWPDYKRSPLLRLVALPYAAHPDFDPSWKPPADSLHG